MSQEKIPDEIKSQRLMIRKTKRSTSTLINIASLIIGLIATIISLLTLNDMRISRNMSYNPDPVLLTSRISFSGSIDNLANNWINDHKTVLAKDYATPIADFTGIPIVNTGMGTAKDVVIEWDDASITGVVQYINKHPANNGQYVLTYTDGLLVISHAGSSSQSNEKLTQRIPYILAADNYESERVIYLGPTIRHLLGLCAGLMDFSTPNIFLSVSYIDIQGRKHNKSIELEVKREYYGLDQGNEFEAVLSLAQVF